ncbi:PF03382 family protein [Bacteriovorax sp. Seq25_V]|nr:PF03382 family protein [Bacteriovorax sp. Seq25_V]
MNLLKILKLSLLLAFLIGCTPSAGVNKVSRGDSGTTLTPDGLRDPKLPDTPLPEDKNKPPKIDQIADAFVYLGDSFTADANDGGDDKDIDNDVLVYSCFVDQNIDGNVSKPAKKCREEGISFNAQNGVLSWVPNTKGTFEIEIIASDKELQDGEIFVLSVIERDSPPPAINNPPNLEPVPTQLVYIGDTLKIDIDNVGTGDVDIDGDRLWFGCLYDEEVDGYVEVHKNTKRWCKDIEGVSVDTATGLIRWSPVAGQEGEFEFVAYVTDGLDRQSDQKFDKEIFKIRVLPKISNKSPKLDSITNKIIKVGEVLNLDFNDGGNDTDIDGDPLYYSCVYDKTVDGIVKDSGAGVKWCGALGGPLNTSTGQMTWMPTEEQVGTYEFMARASDWRQGKTDYLIDRKIFKVTIVSENINNPPVVDPISDQTLKVGQTYEFKITDGGDYKDVDGDDLWTGCFFDQEVDGSVVIHDAQTRKWCNELGVKTDSLRPGVFIWEVKEEHIGKFEFVFHVTDGPTRKTKQKNTQEYVVFTVEKGSVNNPPKIDPVENRTIKEGETLSLDFNDGGDDKDSDGTGLVYTCKVNGSSCPNFSTSRGMLSFVPSQVGIYNFVISASDTVLTDSVSFILTVQDKDGGDPPVADDFRLDPILDKYTVVKGRNHTVVVQVGGSYKYEGQWLNYSCTYDRVVDGSVSSGQNCQLLPTGLLMLSSLLTDYGAYEIKVTASVNGKSASKVFVINSVREEEAALIFKWKSNSQVGFATRFFIGNDSDARKMNFFVDWGDGTITQNSNLHTYSETNKEYTVKVWGTLTSMNFCTDRTGMRTNEPPPHYVTKILQIGDLDYSKIPGFINCPNLYSVNLSKANTLNVTNMDNAFGQWGSDSSRIINEQELIGLENIDTSKVTSMAGMFNNGNLLMTTLDLNHFNTSRVINMAGMFRELSFYVYPAGPNPNQQWCLNGLNSIMCEGKGVQEIKFDRWNTSNVKNMTGMFYGARMIKGLDISHFNTDKLQNLDPIVEEFGKKHGQTFTIDPNKCGSNSPNHPVSGVRDMFRQMSSLEQLNVKNLNTSNLYCLDGTFAELPKLKELDLSHLQTQEIRSMSNTFYMTPLSPKGLDNWQTPKLQVLNGTFMGRGEQSFRFPSWDTSKVESIINLFSTSKSIHIDMSSFDSSSLVSIKGLCNGCWYLKNFKFSLTDSSQLLEVAGLFNDAYRLQEVDLSSFNINFKEKKEQCEKVSRASEYERWCEIFSKKDAYQANDPNTKYTDEYLRIWWYELTIYGKLGDYGSNLGKNYSLQKVRLPSGYNFDWTRQWYDNTNELMKERFRATYVGLSILRIPFILEIDTAGNMHLACPGEEFLQVNNEIGRYVGQDCLTLDDWKDHVKIYANFENENKRQEMAGYLAGKVLRFDDYDSE